jgi:hypothetical protein
MVVQINLRRGSAWLGGLGQMVLVGGIQNPALKTRELHQVHTVKTVVDRRES